MSQQQKGILFGSILFVLFIFAVVMCNRDDDDESIDIINTEQNSSQVIDENNEENDNNGNDNKPSIVENIKETNDFSSEQSHLDDWSNIELQRANTAVRSNNLSKEEKLIILYTNLARMDGSKFCDLYVSPLSQKDPNNSYIKSLVTDLNSVKDLPMLYPNDILIKAAQYHSKDLSSCEDIGHDSSDGTPFHKRLMKFGYKKPCGENVAGGRHDALGVVLDLLIDEGIPDVGHRKNILNKNYNAIGVSRDTHPKYDYNFVMDFGQD